MSAPTMYGSISRAALQPARGFAVRARPQIIRARNARSTRFQSTEAKTTGGSAFDSKALLGGLAGGSSVLLIGYAWYHMSGASTLVNTAHQTKSYVDQIFKKSTEKAPDSNQAIQWLRETVTSYTRMIPGASSYVDSAFDDLEKIREKQGDEVNKIINETYTEMKEATKGGASLEAASKVWDILQNCLKRISKLAGGAAEDIVNNHPQLKEKLGGRIDQFKQMGDQYGPEAKKMVDETWGQVQDILKSGFSAESIPKIQKLIQDKTQQLHKYGDEAWSKGMKEYSKFFEGRQDLKKLIDENKDKLVKGDLGQLWEKIQSATKSGDSEDLKKFVKDQAENMQKKSSSGGGGGGIESILSMIPGGTEIAPKLQQLSELSSKYGSEAEELLKNTMKDVSSVLSKKVEEGQKLKEKAEKDAKS